MKLKSLIEKQAAAISALQAENKELKAVVQSTMVYDYNDGNMHRGQERQYKLRKITAHW